MRLQAVTVSPGIAIGTGTFSDKGDYKSIVYLCSALSTTEVFKAYHCKAKGILSDAGSVCCHGATIARELRIPCMILVDRHPLSSLEGIMLSLDGNNEWIDIYDTK